MNTHHITPDIALLPNRHGRSVLVCGNESTIAIDLPPDADELATLLQTSRSRTPRGLRTVILTREPAAPTWPLAWIAGVRLLRGDRSPEVESDWDEVSRELLQTPEVSVQLVRQPMAIHDDAGRALHIEPCLGEPRCLAVEIEPEDILVCGDDLRSDLPPRVSAGRVHETLLRLMDWQMRAPRVLVPASGPPLIGDEVYEVLDREIRYVRTLYHRIRTGLMEMHMPWERLVYMLPANALWHNSENPRLLHEIHQANIRCMAEDIFQRLQAEAQEVSLVM